MLWLLVSKHQAPFEQKTALNGNTLLWAVHLPVWLQNKFDGAVSTEVYQVPYEFEYYKAAKSIKDSLSMGQGNIIDWFI